MRSNEQDWMSRLNIILEETVLSSSEEGRRQRSAGDFYPTQRQPGILSISIMSSLDITILFKAYWYH